MGNNYTNQIEEEFAYNGEINSSYASCITRTFKIGRNGVANMDFNFAAPASLAQQNLDLGFILPAQCKIVSCNIKCVTALVGVADILMLLGNISAGNQFIASGSVNALNEQINNVASLPAINPLYTKIFLGATPTVNNWNLATAGEWLLTITYKDYSKL